MVSVRSPFTVGAKVTDPHFFVGRRAELHFVMQKMAGDQPTSVNIFGDRRIGKSSLLWNIYQTYEDRLTQFDRQAQGYVVIYLSLQQAGCQDQAAFYQAAAEQFLAQSKVQRAEALTKPLQGAMDAVKFSRAMRAWREVGVLPVICLDNFEELLGVSGQPNPKFGDDFYDNLRALMDDRALMMVVASRATVEIYSRQQKLTSDFFNSLSRRKLGKLTLGEAQQLVSLPDMANPRLKEKRQQLALAWGEQHPCLLQIASDVLFEAQLDDRDEAWAKQQFRTRRAGIEVRRSGLQQIIYGIQCFGDLGQTLGDVIDDWGNFAKGMFGLVVIVLCVLGVASVDDLKSWVKNAVTDVIESAE